MHYLVFLLLLQPQWAACHCVCMDGVPKNVCGSEEAARRGEPVCNQVPSCADDMRRIDPAPGCREIRVWSRRDSGYRSIAICPDVGI